MRKSKTTYIFLISYLQVTLNFLKIKILVSNLANRNQQIYEIPHQQKFHNPYKVLNLREIKEKNDMTIKFLFFSKCCKTNFLIFYIT